MRGRKKLFGLAAFMSVLLIVPLVFSFGVVDVSRFLFGGLPESLLAESSSTPMVFVDPVAISDETLQSGSYFEVYVNISQVTDLFSWQINMSWNPSILNVSNIIAGEFLMRANPVANTSSSPSPFGLGFVINVTDNAEGYTAMGESILGGVPGITGSGQLVSIEFLVTGYGSTDLTISLTGNLATTLLNSTGETLSFTTTDGYFRNKYPGDIDGDSPWDCDYSDFLLFAASYLKTSAMPGYSREADFNLSGAVDYDDFLVFAAAYLKTFS